MTAYIGIIIAVVMSNSIPVLKSIRLLINGAITKAVIKFVEESSFQLQETLAENIAELVKRDFGVKSIKLRVSKPGALRGAKDVGLIIHR